MAKVVDQLQRRYRAFFSIADIEESVALQWAYGALLLGSFMLFNSWMGSVAMSKSYAELGLHRCWSYFQSCGDYYFLESVPYGYSQQMLYMVLLALVIAAVFAVAKKQWAGAHAILLIFFVWQFIAMMVLAPSLYANSAVYYLMLAAAFLFLPHKLFFLKFTTALLYFLAATPKFSDGWIVGTYFSSLATGMPFVPDALIPLATNVVIGAQIFGAWFLLSNVPWQRITATIFFALFHLYSGLFVFYMFVVIALPIELILFGLFPSKTVRPKDSWALAGWAFVLLLIVIQVAGMLLPRYPQLTREGHIPALAMLESNHQCFSKTVIRHTDGREFPSRREWPRAWDSCDPYKEFFRLNQLCMRNPEITSIEWQFAHSVNGKPFQRIVDTPDACSLEGSRWGFNDWILTPGHYARFEGFTVENYYYGTLIVPKDSQ